jgi:6-hydroxycyclohex-1-ene-1-carbonyl-CoA dehydrogenase
MTASGVPLALSEFQAKPAPGEAVVKIAGCGVCHTDLGYYYDGVRTNHALPL